MSTVLSILIIGVTLSYVIWPYLTQRRNQLDGESYSDDGDLLDLLESKDNMLSTIKDLEFDYDIGKLSIEDYNQMNASYRQKTINLFKKIESLTNNDAEVKGKFQVNRQENVCMKCNEICNAKDRYCNNCGHRLISNN